ncbi:MAG: hypothetical protein ACKPKO_44520, partial [Candidatus Fonsibacter sp.]
MRYTIFGLVVDDVVGSTVARQRIGLALRGHTYTLVPTALLIATIARPANRGHRNSMAIDIANLHIAESFGSGIYVVHKLWRLPQSLQRPRHMRIGAATPQPRYGRLPGPQSRSA